MRFSWNTRTLVFTVFILGAFFAYGYFVFFDVSDRDIAIEQSLSEVAIRLAEADEIYRNCLALSNAGTNAPAEIRSRCIETRGFTLWAEGFSFDPHLRGVRTDVLTLARTIEEMTDSISVRPESEVARALLLEIPAEIAAVKKEVVRAERWRLF